MQVKKTYAYKICFAALVKTGKSREWRHRQSPMLSLFAVLPWRFKGVSGIPSREGLWLQSDPALIAPKQRRAEFPSYKAISHICIISAKTVKIFNDTDNSIDTSDIISTPPNWPLALFRGEERVVFLYIHNYTKGFILFESIEEKRG